MRGLVSPTGCAALRQGAALSVTARALSRRSGMLGWRVRASRPAPDWPRILGPWHLVPVRQRGCRFWSGLCAGDRAALALARRLRAGTADAVCPFGSRAAAVLPCVPACRPSRADGGDTGFESRNRWYLLIYSMETVFLCIGRTRRAHGRAWATFPTRQAGMWANDATGRPGALSPALPVSALRVTARPMGYGRYRWCWCLLDIVCSPRIVPSDPREARGILVRWMFEGRGSSTCVSVAHMLEDVINS